MTCWHLDATALMEYNKKKQNKTENKWFCSSSNLANLLCQLLTLAKTVTVLRKDCRAPWITVDVRKCRVCNKKTSTTQH